MPMWGCFGVFSRQTFCSFRLKSQWILWLSSSSQRSTARTSALQLLHTHQPQYRQFCRGFLQPKVGALLPANSSQSWQREASWSSIHRGSCRARVWAPGRLISLARFLAAHDVWLVGGAVVAPMTVGRPACPQPLAQLSQSLTSSIDGPICERVGVLRIDPHAIRSLPCPPARQI